MQVRNNYTESNMPQNYVCYYFFQQKSHDYQTTWNFCKENLYKLENKSEYTES